MSDGIQTALGLIVGFAIYGGVVVLLDMAGWTPWSKK